MKKLLFVLLLIYAGSLTISAQDSHKVLFISSYHPGFSTFFKQVNGLKEEFDREDVMLDIEFMDTKRYPGKENILRFSEFLFFKLRNNEPYDLVIVGDDNALSFALEKQSTYLNNIPIIFLGVNNIENALLQNQNPWITGVIEQVSIEDTVNVMININPDAEEIVAIVDGTSSGQGDLNSFFSISDKFKDRTFSSINLDQLTWNELSGKLQQLDNRSAVLLLSAYFDINNENKSFNESLRLINSSLSIPLYHLWYHGIGEGILGGKVVSHYEQGRAAALLALRVLKGEPVNGINVITESPNQYVFDFNQLKRFEIRTQDMPEDSSILNEPYSFYNSFKKEIWIVIIFVSSLLLSILILLVNLVKRKIAEQSLFKLEKAVNQSPISIVITDISGNIEYVNNSFCSLTGYARKEILGENPRILKNTEIDATDYSSMWATITAGNEWNGIFYNKKKNGDAYCESALITPVLGKKSNIEHFIAIKEDITEKLENEKKNAMLLTAIEQSEDTIEILDTNKKIIYVNPSFSRKTGFSLDDVIGKNPLDIFDNGMHNNEDIDSELWQYLDSGIPWRGQFTNKNKDGTFITEEVSISPVYNKSKDITSYVSVKRDITDFMNLIEEKNTIQEHLYQAQKLESLGQLSSGIAHDFNNILSGIMSASQLLLNPERNIDEKARKYGDMIFSSCQRAADITSKLLNFSQRNKSEIKETAIDNLIKETIEILQHTINKSIEISFQGTLKNHIIYCDASSIQNALLNLGINAGHAIEQSGTINFILSMRILNSEYCQKSSFEINPGNYCSIKVADTGCGIKEENLNNIYEAFFTTKEIGKGTGLGLSSVKRIIEEHNGCIEVESEINIGTTFELLLPL